MKNKQSQLSPENYIRTRARTLPIGDCLINEDWRDSGFAMITVTREHINGNITHGAYLVDLYCLGVKECFWMFNQPPEAFREFMNKQVRGNEFGLRNKKTSYPLVHNIIYGAEAFAGDLGFKPHKSFELARYLIEEDDERIKLIDIEFGYKGKPLYISVQENQTEKNRVFAHLEKTVGSGNFNFITEAEADEFFKREEGDEGGGINFSDPEEKKRLISEVKALTDNPKKLLPRKPEKVAELIELAEVVFLEYMVSADELKTASEAMEKLFDFTITDQVLSEDFIFGKSAFRDNRGFIRKEADRLMILASEGKVAKGQPEVERLIAQYPDMPVLKYLLLRFMEIKTGVRKLKPTIKFYADLYPDYLPLTYLYLNAALVDRDPVAGSEFPAHLHLKNYYPGKTTFCIEEILQYFHLLVIYHGISGDVVNLIMLIGYMESNHPGLIPDEEIFSAKLLMVPGVVDWCENWLKEESKAPTPS